mmetsp:Transcript_59440/g.166017  ORF Transcript_59440/g.166017 Transcript_59440/m.166017 type:complete len:206 (+) Transcript_59440:526-1143(+)
MPAAAIKTPRIVLAAVHIDIQWFLLSELHRRHTPSAQLLEKLKERQERTLVFAILELLNLARQLASFSKGVLQRPPMHAPKCPNGRHNLCAVMTRVRQRRQRVEEPGHLARVRHEFPDAHEPTLLDCTLLELCDPTVSLANLTAKFLLQLVDAALEARHLHGVPLFEFRDCLVTGGNFVRTSKLDLRDVALLQLQLLQRRKRNVP